MRVCASMCVSVLRAFIVHCFLCFDLKAPNLLCSGKKKSIYLGLILPSTIYYSSLWVPSLAVNVETAVIISCVWL